MKLIYNGISKVLLYHCKDPLKLRVLSFESTGISTVNIAKATIHFETKLLVLNEKYKATLINRLSEVKFLIIDKRSMVRTTNLWHLFEYVELTEVMRQMIICLSTNLKRFQLITLMIM